ncbi:hypothetical protein [Singulisphaera sp. PoT]|uniref:hypothetical protein n=1 Tax=Singulisphaera sp. PoT TaxID=3411797 RepID=UPI003BF4B730
MNKQEHLLVCLMEECAEIIELCSRISVRASKALRFGADEVQPEQDRTNAERLALELADLKAVAEMLIEAEVIPASAVPAKRVKVEAFMEYARQCGALSGPELKPKPPYRWRRGDRLRCTMAHDSYYAIDRLEKGDEYTFDELDPAHPGWAFVTHKGRRGVAVRTDYSEWIRRDEGGRGR